MTEQERIEQIKEIERKRFYLAMKDRWNQHDYIVDATLFREWLDLNKGHLTTGRRDDE